MICMQPVKRLQYHPSTQKGKKEKKNCPQMSRGNAERRLTNSASPDDHGQSSMEGACDEARCTSNARELLHA